jgi:flavin-dependent dehydrogenase
VTGLDDLHARYDVVVVGARCAGAATAMLLARHGARVLAVDRARRGSDTLSTHALMRGGVLQLARWGLLEGLVSTGTPPVRTTTFHYGPEIVAVPIKPKAGTDALYAPRRTVLDALLADAAEAAGATLRFGVRVATLVRDPDGRPHGVVLEGPPGTRRHVAANLVIGADGARSGVARMVGARAYRDAPHAGAVVYGYWRDLAVDGFHWYYRPGVGAGVIPTNGGQTCVFVALPAARFQALLHAGPSADLQRAFVQVARETAPELADLVRAGTPCGGLRGYAGEPGFVRQSWGPGWALVGDAAAFRDPITAHGITDALRDAELLARAVADGTAPGLAAYQAARDALATRLFEITDDIASFAWDLPHLQRLHRALSDEMVREAEWIAQLGPALPPTRGTHPADARPTAAPVPLRA